MGSEEYIECATEWKKAQCKNEVWSRLNLGFFGTIVEIRLEIRLETQSWVLVFPKCSTAKHYSIEY